jgi:hypothetical protein
MKRALFSSLTLIAVGLMAGCGGGGVGSGCLLGCGGPPQPNALNGRYAFVLTGFDTNSSGAAANPISMAGSFISDGLGDITGEVDVNDNGTVSSSTSLVGTYSFDANQLGALVTVKFTNPVTNVAHPLAFGIALQSSGAFGDITSLDANNFIAAGTIQQQNSSVFSLSSLAGDYIITLNGRNAAVPTSALGRFTLDASGASTNVIFDRSIAAVGSAGPTTGSSAGITFGSTGPDSNGRGTLTVTIGDALAPAFGTHNFVYYAITANRFVAVETDATGTMIADASRQTTLSSFTATTVNTAGSVFGVAGIDTSASNEISAIGQFIISGSNSATLQYDFNDNGNSVGPINLNSLPVTFDPTSGRGTITLASGFSNGLFDSAVFYLTASGTGFILDGEPGTNNRAMAGTLSSQSGSPFASPAISGQMIVRTRGSSVNDAQTLIGTFAPTTTSGVYNFALDQVLPPLPANAFVDVDVTGVTAQILVSSTGRGTWSIPATTSTGAPTTATWVFYLIGPNQMNFIDESPASSGISGPSPLYFVNPF